MRVLRPLMLALAVAAAGASAHKRHPSLSDHLPEGARPHGLERHEDRHEGHRHGHPEKDGGLVDYLNEQFQASASLVQQFLGLGEEDVVVVIEEEEEEEQVSRQQERLACLTALATIHEKKELEEAGDELASRLHASLRSAFQLVSVHYLDETSCDDLREPAVVEEVRS